MTTEMPDDFAVIDDEDAFEMFTGPLYRKQDGSGMVYGFRVRPEHCNSGRICHGGMLMTFADFAICSAAVFETDESPVTISMTTDFMAPVRTGDLVIATCEIMRKTASMVFCRTDLTVEGQRVVAVSGVVKRIRRSV